MQTDNFNTQELLVDSELFGKKKDIVVDMSAVAGQEGCDDHEYDLIHQAQLYITFLRKELSKRTNSITNGDKVIYRECFDERAFTFIGMAYGAGHLNDCYIMNEIGDSVPAIYEELELLEEGVTK